MDIKRLYVDFHVLQTVPPSCVNRDDTGSPKTAVYGGATRARVSSQAWKHAIRKMFIEEMADMVETGKRTLKATDLVAGELAALAPELDDARLKKDAKKALENAGIKLKDDNNAALLFLSTAQARRWPWLAAEDCEEKDDYKKGPEGEPFGGYGSVWPDGRQRSFPELRCRRSGGPQHLHPCRAERV